MGFAVTWWLSLWKLWIMFFVPAFIRAALSKCFPHDLRSKRLSSLQELYIKRDLGNLQDAPGCSRMLQDDWVTFIRNCFPLKGRPIIRPRFQGCLWGRLVVPLDCVSLWTLEWTICSRLIWSAFPDRRPSGDGNFELVNRRHWHHQRTSRRAASLTSRWSGRHSL